MKNSEKLVAFLRGVNVNGTSMKMAEVCEVFSENDCTEVSSVLATGNIIFNSDFDKDILKDKLEKALSKHFNYEAFLFVKSAEEIKTIFKNNPFPKDNNFHVYSFITISKLEQDLLDYFNNTEKPEGEEAKILNQNFYWKVKKASTLDSNFGKILGKKMYKNSLTSRNINTIEKIIAKL